LNAPQLANAFSREAGSCTGAQQTSIRSSILLSAKDIEKSFKATQGVDGDMLDSLVARRRGKHRWLPEVIRNMTH
jgi:hypothetical protein